MLGRVENSVNIRNFVSTYRSSYVLEKNPKCVQRTDFKRYRWCRIIASVTAELTHAGNDEKTKHENVWRGC